MEVPRTPSSSRRLVARVLRQDRHKALNCQLILGNDVFEVRDYSAFGIGVHAEHDIHCKGSEKATLRVERLDILSIEVAKKRATRSDDGTSWVIGFEVLGDPLPVFRIQAAAAASEMLIDQHRSFLAARLPPLFVRRVYEMKNYLESLEERTNALVEEAELNSRQELHDFEGGVVDVVSTHLEKALEPLYEELAPILDGMPSTELQLAYEFFRGQLRHLIYQAPIANRMLRKPRGYAGDFEMMKSIYRNELMGTSLFAKCIQRYYASHPNARAVRNRAVFLSKQLTEALNARSHTDFRVLSVACGPAHELELLLEGRANLAGVSFGLLDQDLDALRDAQRNLTKVSRKFDRKLDLSFHHKAIKNVLKEGVPGPYDLIYSAGLFDYFSDAVAKAVTKRLLEALAPGGCLIIGNFTAKARNRTLMELALDWNLIYRTEVELRRLYSGMGGKLELAAEPEGINLFVVLHR